jgi:hypothetical protein
MTDRKIIKNKSGKNQHNEVKSQNETKPPNLSTADRLAEQYSVSRATINRDARVAEAIRHIGEASPEAKRMILSGEARIDKKELEELSSRPMDEISKIAMGIEDGTYKKKTASSTPEKPGRVVDLIIAGMKPLESIIKKISDGVDSGLERIEKPEERKEVKTALMSYINKLQDLYSRI